MTPLPTSEVLAKLVTNVTKTMLGISFEPDQRHTEPPQELRWRTAVLPIPGKRSITVGLSSDQPGCSALSAAMFQVKPAEVDDGMIEDSLRELTNITAGLVKNAVGLDQALGLPKIIKDTEHPVFKANPPNGQAVVLQAQGLGLVLWVCEGIVLAQ
jgi:hypothetical protein